MSCEDGEEPRIHALAAHFSARADGLAESFPRMPADHLFLMAALLVTDELFEAREELQTTLKQMARLGGALDRSDHARRPNGSEMAQIVRDASARLGKLGADQSAGRMTEPNTGSTTERQHPPAGSLGRKAEEASAKDADAASADDTPGPETPESGKLAKGAG